MSGPRIATHGSFIGLDPIEPASENAPPRHGDRDALFLALADEIATRLGQLFDLSRIAGLESYLHSDDVREWQYDRRDVRDGGITFAFHERPPHLMRFAVHAYQLVIASEIAAIEARARDFGFAVVRDSASLVDEALFARFVTSSPRDGSFVLEADPWLRGQPVDQPARVSAASRELLDGVRSDQLQPATQLGLATVAMTGCCLCPACAAIRARHARPAVNAEPRIAQAWQLLEHEPTAQALASDPAGTSVLGDWLEQHGAAIAPPLVVGLVQTFRNATPATFHVVVTEDTYETRYGDGYYAYFGAAFWTREEATAWIATKAVQASHSRDMPPAYHVRPGRLVRDGAHWSVQIDLEHHERADATTVLEALGLAPALAR